MCKVGGEIVTAFFGYTTVYPLHTYWTRLAKEMYISTFIYYFLPMMYYQKERLYLD